MSGLLGNPGPGILGKIMGEADRRNPSKEKPGFSNTKVQDAQGNWVGVDRNRRRNRRRDRTKGLVMSAFSGIF